MLKGVGGLPIPFTHAHPTHTYGRLRPYTHIRPHTAAGRRPASLSGRRHAAQRLASRWPAGWPAGRPGPCGRLPATKNRFRIIKIPTFQMVPKYHNNTPMGSKMPSNHIKMHFCASNHIILTSCQGKLLQGSVSFAPMAFGNCSKPQSAETGSGLAGPTSPGRPAALYAAEAQLPQAAEPPELPPPPSPPHSYHRQVGYVV